jgi:hypothetical protein
MERARSSGTVNHPNIDLLGSADFTTQTKKGEALGPSEWKSYVVSSTFRFTTATARLRLTENTSELVRSACSRRSRGRRAAVPAAGWALAPVVSALRTIVPRRVRGQNLPADSLAVTTRVTHRTAIGDCTDTP